jgi:hypothetical protein
MSVSSSSIGRCQTKWRNQSKREIELEFWVNEYTIVHPPAYLTFNGASEQARTRDLRV